MQIVPEMAHITFIHNSSDRINPLVLPHCEGDCEALCEPGRRAEADVDKHW